VYNHPILLDRRIIEMPFKSTRAKLFLSPNEIEKLKAIVRSRTEGFSRIERAKIILAYAQGETVSSIARSLKTNRPKVERHISKALEIGVEAALEDLPRKGKPQAITPEARAWLVSLACQKPKDLGYSYELWTTRLLAQHIQKHCHEHGHDCLAKLSRGTVSKILAANKVKPHKIKYYLERRDPNFEDKMVQVLHVYKDVQLISQAGKESMTAFVSYDEKPGIQAIENTTPDLPPCPGKYTTIGRDHEYIRHGTLSLLAGIDLVTGEIIATVEERHRSREFINFLKALDARYADREKVKVVLDNHSSHTSKETRAYLATVPNRFEFIFTPKHGELVPIAVEFA
jgi:transposase